MATDIEIARTIALLAHRRDRGAGGHPARCGVPPWSAPRQARPRLCEFAEEPTRRQADPGHRHQPDAARRGQDHHHDRPGRRPEPHRPQARRHSAPGAVAGPGLRPQGRGDGRRLGAGRAHGRRSTCTSPATSTPSPPPTTSWPRMLDNHVYWGNALDIDPPVPSPGDACARRQRSRPAQDRGRGPGRRCQWRSARDRLRHHRRLGGHGRPVPRRRTWPTCRRGWPASWSAVARKRTSR